jgi:hypothetical protein
MSRLSQPNSSITILTTLWIGRLRNRSWIPGKGNKFFLSSTASRPALGPTQPLIQWAPRAVCPETKRPEREADHTRPSNAEVKNGGAITPFSHTSLWRGVLIIHKDNFARCSLGLQSLEYF